MSLRTIISQEVEALRKAMVVCVGDLARQVKSDFIADREHLKEYRHRIAQLEQRLEQLDTRLTMVAGNGNRMRERVAQNDAQMQAEKANNRE